jgi:uncharacterized protein YjgD (DUF1641 family)
MKFEFAAIVLATALLTTVSIIPLNYAGAQNTTMPQREDVMTAAMIKIMIDKFRSEHPVFAAVLDKVTSMDASQTLKAIIGANALERILDSHAKNILQNQTGSIQSTTMPQTDHTMTAAMIKIKIDKFRSEHPLFAAVLDKVTSMDASQTLKAIIGSHALERILDSHAQNILQNQTGSMQNQTGSMQNQTGSVQYEIGPMQNQTGSVQNITSMS